jgi:hypothetical protein
MKSSRLIALACLAFAPVVFAGPFDAFKGKVKEGMYEYKMEMDMGAVPGMPPGMKGPMSHTFQRCVTPEDVERGEMGKGREGKGMPENCEVRDMKMSGNTASYTMECKPPRAMKAENNITFTGDGWKMDMKMAMAQGPGGQPMNMTQHMEARYLGPCK